MTEIHTSSRIIFHLFHSKLTKKSNLPFKETSNPSICFYQTKSKKMISNKKKLRKSKLSINPNQRFSKYCAAANRLQFSMPNCNQFMKLRPISKQQKNARRVQWWYALMINGCIRLWVRHSSTATRPLHSASFAYLIFINYNYWLWFYL